MLYTRYFFALSTSRSNCNFLYCFANTWARHKINSNIPADPDEGFPSLAG
jgi:hypothetical protein